MCDFNYGITIKCIKTGEYKSESNLLARFAECIDRHKGIPIMYTFESDSLGRLHLHGLFMARKGIRLNLYKKPYYTIHIDPLKTIQDVQNWTNYIKKDSYKEFMEKLINGEYMFDQQASI